MYLTCIHYRLCIYPPGNDWVECDEIKVGKDILGKTTWFEESLFFLDQGSCVVSVNVSLKFKGDDGD